MLQQDKPSGDRHHAPADGGLQRQVPAAAAGQLDVQLPGAPGPVE